MSLSLTLLLLTVTYIALSVLYVYRWRGDVRYPSFMQFLRKSWPVFAPLNCLLYLATDKSARAPVLGADYLEGISVLRERWAHIRDEAFALHRSGALEATTTVGSAGYHDIGFRTFYQRGWKKFYLKWYGEPHHSAQRLCPETIRALQSVPGIRAAMFSVLPPGAELRLHSDPMACSLRYHLGLETPNRDECFINVDGHEVSWRNGADFVFDETYPHFAANNTSEPRLILMCDVERPMNWAGRAFNRVYSRLATAMTVPNTPEDRRGFVSGLYAKLVPLREAGLRLKRKNRRAYVTLKIMLNTSLVLLVFMAMFSVLQFAEAVGSATVS